MPPTTSNKNPGCLSVILSIFKRSPKGNSLPLPQTLPYKLRDTILSPAEISFLKVLQNSIQGKFEIQCKMRLADIFYTPYGTNISYFNRIAEKHVDFLLCDPATMKPILGIELDDNSHRNPNRQQRDEFVNAVFKAAGLALLRLPVKRAYNQQEMVAQIKQVLNTNQSLDLI